VAPTEGIPVRSPFRRRYDHNKGTTIGPSIAAYGEDGGAGDPAAFDDQPGVTAPDGTHDTRPLDERDRRSVERLRDELRGRRRYR
jgi:hypothetical protein